MFIKIWNFLWGYVTIEISGFGVERFISSAISKNVIFWDMHRDGGKFVARVTLKDFKRLDEVSQKTGSSVVALNHHGLPPVFASLKKRVFLVFGGAAFVLGLILLTSFIWRIDIEGTQRLDPAEMLVFLEQEGFALGNFRHRIPYREIENLLLLQFDDIAWVSLSVTGTRALISIIETIYQPLEIPPEHPADIVAAKDGIIVYMATSAGQPQFRPGDVVAAGDVIVSGQLVLGSAEEGNLSFAYTVASSEVWARVYYRMNFDIPLTYFEKSFTGEVQTRYSIHIGSWSFDFPMTFGANHDFIYYEETARNHQMSFGQNYPLPLGRITTRAYELTRHLRSRSAEAAQALAEEFAIRLIAEEIGEDVEILEKQISFTQGERELTAEVFLVTIERIDESVELRVESGELEDGTD